MDDVFRLYEPGELGADGYPPEWHRAPKGAGASMLTGIRLEAATTVAGRGIGIKHIVRFAAGSRCVRCGHPWVRDRAGEDWPEWSPCDERCTHGGPVRWQSAITGNWHERDDDIGVHQVEFALKEVAATEARWRVLTVHHLNGRKEDCRWHNLVALCQRLRCHLQIQGRVRMEQVLPHEHSTWFKPYAAAYYASVYLGEELSRAETMARLDELLALERTA